ncbi:isoprenylcysteine carboxylmethyltransferase family protein [Patescibacteria group bacterium]|nr:isoprenylcysteine carboxylmethyltransferase family protein [Patescibacteria group bacterium]MBU1727875.1 isoprenylcysteine carboxylmethyltransferase family protein [Patescibacteria group bacterium]
MEEKRVKQEKTAVRDITKANIHALQLYSYIFYFFMLLLGVFLDFIFPIGIPIQSILMPISVSFLIIASVLIIWAQNANRNLNTENLTKETFSSGPYFFIKNPTHMGLFLLVLGFGILANAFFVVIFTIISYVVTKFIFLKREEKILEAKYGEPYMEYKKSVKF